MKSKFWSFMLYVIIIIFLLCIGLAFIVDDNVFTIQHNLHKDYYQKIELSSKVLRGKIVHIENDEIFIDTPEGRFRCPMLYVLDNMDVQVGDRVTVYLESAPTIVKE